MDIHTLKTSHHLSTPIQIPTYMSAQQLIKQEDQNDDTSSYATSPIHTISTSPSIINTTTTPNPITPISIFSYMNPMGMMPMGTTIPNASQQSPSPIAPHIDELLAIDPELEAAQRPKKRRRTKRQRLLELQAQLEREDDGSEEHQEQTEQLLEQLNRPSGRKRRRIASELVDSEKWFCPYECGKFYRKTSTRSIYEHQCECRKKMLELRQQGKEIGSAAMGELAKTKSVSNTTTKTNTTKPSTTPASPAPSTQPTFSLPNPSLPLALPTPSMSLPIPPATFPSFNFLPSFPNFFQQQQLASLLMAQAAQSFPYHHLSQLANSNNHLNPASANLFATPLTNSPTPPSQAPSPALSVSSLSSLATTPSPHLFQRHMSAPAAGSHSPLPPLTPSPSLFTRPLNGMEIKVNPIARSYVSPSTPTPTSHHLTLPRPIALTAGSR